MRRLVDIAAVLLVAAVAWAIVSMRLGHQREEDTVRTVVTGVQRFQDEVQRHAAVGDGNTNARGWPVTIDPAWFGGSPPQNPLLSPDRPWVEVATPEQAYLLHPEVRLAADSRLAAFWYNPYQGVVRTRVPATMSDEKALRLYNRLNHSSLTSIFQPEPAPRTEPLVLPPPDAGTSEHPAPADATDPKPEQKASADDGGKR